MSINFKRGDIVNANGEIAVILDVLASDDTDDIILKVRFVRNIGDSRAYDTLDLTPAKAKIMRIDQWQLATHEELAQAIQKRQAYLAREISDLLALTKKTIPTVA